MEDLKEHGRVMGGLWVEKEMKWKWKWHPVCRILSHQVSSTYGMGIISISISLKAMDNFLGEIARPKPRPSGYLYLYRLDERMWK